MVVDGSTDGTASFLRRDFGGRVRVVEQANAGPYTLTITPVPQVCGDGVANGTEVCDGAAVGGAEG